MEMKAEQLIRASREKVWAALNDTEILKASMPGCESFEAIDATNFHARIMSKVGPVKARFSFTVSLSDLDPPRGYTITGEGKGGAAGFANGSARVTLADSGADTVLGYEVKANVGGKLAQMGARLIDGTAKKMADEFFTNFTRIVTGNAEGDTADQVLEQSSLPRPKRRGLPGWIWIVALILLATILIGGIA